MLGRSALLSLTMFLIVGCAGEAACTLEASNILYEDIPSAQSRAEVISYKHRLSELLRTCVDESSGFGVADYYEVAVIADAPELIPDKIYSQRGEELLLVSAAMSTAETVRYILNRTGDPNISDDSGRSLLGWSVVGFQQESEVTQLLLDAGAHVGDAMVGDEALIEFARRRASPAVLEALESHLAMEIAEASSGYESAPGSGALEGSF